MGELWDIMGKDPESFWNIRNLGSKSALEVVQVMEQFGFDGTVIREEAEKRRAYYFEICREIDQKSESEERTPRSIYVWKRGADPALH